MKKIITILTIAFLCAGLFGQKKITDLTATTSAAGTSIQYTHDGTEGHGLRKITKANYLSDVGDYISDTIVGLTAADTILYFAPVIGAGNAGDTTLFSYGDVIWACKWDGSYDLVITKVTGVVYGTTPDIDVALLYDVNFRDATPTTVFSSDLTITSTTTGNDATISANDTITPGTWIWVRIDQCTAQPTQCIINVYGYLE